MLYVETGVWHNPRIIKQKQYIPKYALTLANLIRNDYKLPDLLFLRIDSSVKICMVRVRERLSADNRLQRYNKKSNYTNKSIFCCHFFASRTQITYLRNVLLNSERVVTNLS